MIQNIRVAMLGAYPTDPAHVRGGVQAAYAYLVKGLVQIPGVELHVLTFRAGGYDVPDELKQDNLTTHFLPPYPRFERIRNYHNFQSVVDTRLAQIQPDLIHVQDVAAEAYVALRSGYPALMTMHGIRGEDRKHMSSWLQQVRSYFDSAFIEKYCLTHAKHLIAVSRYAIGYYQPILNPDTAVYHIPNAVDERFFCEHQAPDTNTVLFAGRVTPLKRVMDLVQAFSLVVKQIPSAQLRIAGETSSESSYVQTIRQWIQKAQLEEHIHLLGPLAETAILEEFASCNILALPSAQESAPMVIAQAMAAGRPVIATRVGGVAEMVGETSERGLLVDVGNIEQMAKAIIRLMQDRRLQVSMGQKGRAFALENYHLKEVARRTADIYRVVLAKEQHIRD